MTKAANHIAETSKIKFHCGLAFIKKLNKFTEELDILGPRNTYVKVHYYVRHGRCVYGGGRFSSVKGTWYTVFRSTRHFNPNKAFLSCTKQNMKATMFCSVQITKEEQDSFGMCILLE